MGGRLHGASRFPHDDREPLPAPLRPWMVQRLVDAAESRKVERPGRPPDANPLADGKARLLGAEARQDAE